MAEPTFDIPKECKAGVVHNEGPDFELKVEMVPVPEPGPDEILIKLNATGICMSDVHWLMNDLAPVPMSSSPSQKLLRPYEGVKWHVDANII